MDYKDYELECARLELELEDEKAAKEKLEAENEELKDNIIDLKDKISDLQVEISEHDDGSTEIDELKTINQNLHSELEVFEEATTYKICGEDVRIQTDSIDYQTFFELLSVESDNYKNVQSLFHALTRKK